MSLAWLVLCLVLSLGGFSAEEAGALVTIESPLPGSVFAQVACLRPPWTMSRTDNEQIRGMKRAI